MNSMRQLGTALFYALVSVVLVVGGLSLALAEGGVNAPKPTAKPSPTLFLSSTPPAPVSPTAPFAASITPQIVYVTATESFTANTTSQPAVVTATATLRVNVYPSATSRTYNPTPFRCGPYYGWIKAYTVQQGDTLYHISTLYQTTVNALQVANCLQGTFIFPGELLWVPNVPTVTPGVTLIPTFETPTNEPPTDTAVPPTDTAIPTITDTAIPSSP